jgi:hypothetical protein
MVTVVFCCSWYFCQNGAGQYDKGYEAAWEEEPSIWAGKA